MGRRDILLRLSWSYKTTCRREIVMPEWWWNAIGLTLGVGLGMSLIGMVTALPIL